MFRIALSFVVFLSVPYFSTLFNKLLDFQGGGHY